MMLSLIKYTGNERFSIQDAIDTIPRRWFRGIVCTIARRRLRQTLLATALTFCFSASGQISRLGEEIEYRTEANGQTGKGDHTPFWQSANRYGLTSVNNNSGYIRICIQRNVETDSLRKWRIGYGADLVAPFNYTSKFIVQQAFANFQYKAICLSIGQKERPLEMKNQLLTSGGMTMGINARPIPQVRLEMPDFFVIKKTKNWIALKGHVAYGRYTDNRWQKDFNAGANTSYTANSFYHSKAGYLRVGNTEKFPVTFTGGFEMVCQFGGIAYNLPIKNSNGDIETTHKQNVGLKEFLQAFIPTGSDIIDGDNKNVMGNHLGSYQARLDYHGKGWKASVYGEHFFEDHSQMGWDFDWKDFLWGTEITLPKNRFVNTILYEHLRTTDQSGAVFKSMGSNHMPSAIGGVDDYYNHGLYGAYQHAGHVMGNPLLISPVYNPNHFIYCFDNRVKANHFGISGQPHTDIAYRLLYTHEKSWGTYKSPRTNPVQSDFLMAEITYQPHQIKGLGFTANYAQDWGKLTGHNKGIMLTISYRGVFNSQNRDL